MTRSQLFALWISFLVLQAVAFVNAFVVDLKGGTIDAVRFQDAARDWADFGVWEFAVNSEFFVQYLGTLYRIFGPSEFIATQFGLAAMMLAALLLIRFARALGFVFPALGLIVFLLWPSMLLRITTTLREPYMIFCVILSFYGLLRFSQTGRVRYAVISVAAIGLEALFHKALAVLAPFLILIIIWKFLFDRGLPLLRKSGWIGLGLFGLGVVAIGSFAAFETTVKGLKPLQSLLLWDTAHISQVLEYKTGRDFRTTYDAALDFSDPLRFLTSLGRSFLYYMFMPFPWLVRSPLDILAFVEASFRFFGSLLIVRFVLLERAIPTPLRPVLLAGFLLTLIWAVGTANYGTASRHHLTTNWLFFMIYVACFTRRVPSLDRRFALP
ncbi:MAG: hypothetical protein AAF429_12110 [Pseudomonadota bacterium]